MLCEDDLCEDMLMEILSRLPVKSLNRFICVNKYFQSLILDTRFLTMHLQNARKRTNFLLNYSDNGKSSCYVVASPISSLFEDSTSFFSNNIMNGSKPQKNKYRVFGSCNGLVCLTIWDQKVPDIIHLWNPATRVLIQHPHSLDSQHSPFKLGGEEHVSMLGFGYDNSRHSYKVVAIVAHLDHPFRSVIWNLNDKRGWEDIQDFPVDPTTMEGDGVYLNNTLNWLGMPNYDGYEYDDFVISFDKVVIASLDLETEIYTQMLLPRELNGVSIGDFCSLGEQLHYNEAPLLGVLSGCLSLFLHNRRTKHLSIWQMKEFGNQRSWILLLNKSLQDLGVNPIQLPTNLNDYLRRILTIDDQRFSFDSNLLPLCMIENDRDIVIIQSSFQGCAKQIIIYNLRDKTVTSRKMADNFRWIYPLDYVESLVSPRLN